MIHVGLYLLLASLGMSGLMTQSLVGLEDLRSHHRYYADVRHLSGGLRSPSVIERLKTVEEIQQLKEPSLAGELAQHSSRPERGLNSS